jgi:hypothetical protein
VAAGSAEGRRGGVAATAMLAPAICVWFFGGSGNGGVSEPRGVRRHGSERRGGEEDPGSGRLVAEGGLHGGSVPSRRA